MAYCSFKTTLNVASQGILVEVTLGWLGAWLLKTVHLYTLLVFEAMTTSADCIYYHITHTLKNCNSAITYLMCVYFQFSGSVISAVTSQHQRFKFQLGGLSACHFYVLLSACISPPDLDLVRRCRMVTAPIGLMQRQNLTVSNKASYSLFLDILV